jgi:integral membrane protein
MKNPVPFLRRIAIIEAISFIVLLLVAMPLKYLLNLPQAVTAVGSIHGGLFVIFCASLLHTLVLARWPIQRAAMVFVASLLPFVPFFLDRKMRAYEQDYQPQGTGA